MISCSHRSIGSIFCFLPSTVGKLRCPANYFPDYALAPRNSEPFYGFPRPLLNDNDDRRHIFTTHFVVLRRIGIVLTYLLQLIGCDIFPQEALESPDYFRQYPPSNFGSRTHSVRGRLLECVGISKLGDIDWSGLRFEGYPFFRNDLSLPNKVSPMSSYFECSEIGASLYHARTSATFAKDSIPSRLGDGVWFDPQLEGFSPYFQNDQLFPGEIGWG